MSNTVSSTLPCLRKCIAEKITGQPPIIKVKLYRGRDYEDFHIKITISLEILYGIWENPILPGLRKSAQIKFKIGILFKNISVICRVLMKHLYLKNYFKMSILAMSAPFLWNFHSKLSTQWSYHTLNSCFPLWPVVIRGFLSTASFLYRR